jgi:putative ABC transport system permease protein
MLKSYLTIALRNLYRHKIFSAINVIGLAIGLTACLFIVLFVQDELSYDGYHTKADRLYRLYTKGKVGGNDIQTPLIGSPAGPALVNDYPFVESATRLREMGSYIVGYGERKFKEEKVVFADPGFFQTFSVPMIVGDPKTALAKPNSVVITETVGKKYFGNTDPVGKLMNLGTDGLYKVTGVCRDVPSNTHFAYNIFASLITIERDPQARWLANGLYTYLVLAEGATAQSFERKSPEIVKKYIGADIQHFIGVSLEEFLQTGGRFGFFLQPVTDIHLPKVTSILRTLLQS